MKNRISMRKIQPAIPWPKLREDGSFGGEPIVLDSRKTLLRDRGARWTGKDFFSASVNGGWNDSGFVLECRVTDDDVFNDRIPPLLWEQDCVEVFIAAPAGRVFGSGKNRFERIQILIGPPDKSGKNDSYLFICNGSAPDFRYEVSGKLTDGGYSVRLEIPWESFGDYDPRKEKFFRMQLSCDDYNRADGKTLYPRAMTFRGAGRLSESSVSYLLFRLSTSGDVFPRSLELEWTPDIPRIMDSGRLEIALNLPDFLDSAELSLRDSAGSEILRVRSNPGDKILCADGLSGLRCDPLTVFLTGFRNGVPAGSVSAECLPIAGYAAKFDWKTAPPWKLAWQSSIVSTVEFLKLTMAKDSMNAGLRGSAAMELACRSAVLNGRPLPRNAPPQYRFLNLARGFAAQLNVSYSRSGNEPNFIAVSLPWGNIPCVNAEIRFFRSPEEAERYLISETEIFASFAPPQIPGADDVFAGRGHLLGDALIDDLQTDRLLSLCSPLFPNKALRFVPQDAFEMPVDSVCVMNDSPESMRKTLLDFAKKHGLPEISFQEYGKYRLTAVAGTPPKNLFFSFWHSRNGVPNDFLVVRKDSTVLMCGYDNRELGLKFMNFLLAGKPVTRKFAAECARLRASVMAKPSPEDFEAAKGLRTGDVHTHTIFSDGQSTPAGLLANLPIAGLDFLVLTDHHRVEGAFRLRENMRKHGLGLNLVTGEEITMAPKYHINLYPLEEFVNPNTTWPAIHAYAKAHGTVTQFDHPMTYGTNFSALWYGDFMQAGFDAVERRIEFLEQWRKSGKRVPAIVGSTDTHKGIFGYFNCTAVLAPEFSGKTLAEAVKANRCAMIDPFLPRPAYGSEAVERAVAAALLDPENPERFGERLKKAFADFSPAGFIHDSEISTGLPSCFEIIDQKYLKLEPESTLTQADK